MNTESEVLPSTEISGVKLQARLGVLHICVSWSPGSLPGPPDLLQADWVSWSHHTCVPKLQRMLPWYENQHFSLDFEKFEDCIVWQGTFISRHLNQLTCNHNFITKAAKLSSMQNSMYAY